MNAAALITPGEATTLPSLFRERVTRTPDATAYLTHDPLTRQWLPTTWSNMAEQVALWQAGLAQEGYAPGDRMAIMLNNRRTWVLFDQAVLGLGLVVVPLYMDDRPDNVAHVLANSGARFLLLPNLETWQRLEPAQARFPNLARVVYLTRNGGKSDDPRVRHVCDWLPPQGAGLQTLTTDPDALATIIYTSGTTGPPKGVMLSHRNILLNAHASLTQVAAGADDLFLSFLPLSHALERTAGYYLAMMAGATVAFARSVPQLLEDMATLRPTVLISVPRIYERLRHRIHERLLRAPAWRRWLFQMTESVGWRRFLVNQQRAAWSPLLLLWPLLDRLVARKVRGMLGGRLRVAISGGARLAEPVAKLAIGLGIPLLQGYGMTETSPVVAVNTLADNDPETVGPPLPQLEVAIAWDGELLVRGGVVMLGYWDNPEATARVIDPEGWLHTGDAARLEHGHLRITGRFKEIIVLATGHKVPAGDLESALQSDPLLGQVLVLGEGLPFLTMLAAPEPVLFAALAQRLGLAADDPEVMDSPRVKKWLLARAGELLAAFPGFMRIRGVVLSREPWSVANGLLTPTLKPVRERIIAREEARVRAVYGENP